MLPSLNYQHMEQNGTGMRVVHQFLQVYVSLFVFDLATFGDFFPLLYPCGLFLGMGSSSKLFGTYLHRLTTFISCVLFYSYFLAFLSVC